MSIWQHYNNEEKLVMLQQTAAAKKVVEQALENTDLYETIISHRKKFNNIQGIDYKTHYPATIQICPPENLTSIWKEDYEKLRESFVYDETKKPFDELTDRMLELTSRIKEIKLKYSE